VLPCWDYSNSPPFFSASCWASFNFLILGLNLFSGKEESSPSPSSMPLLLLVGVPATAVVAAAFGLGGGLVVPAAGGGESAEGSFFLVVPPPPRCTLVLRFVVVMVALVALFALFAFALVVEATDAFVRGLIMLSLFLLFWWRTMPSGTVAVSSSGLLIVMLMLDAGIRFLMATCKNNIKSERRLVVIFVVRSLLVVVGCSLLFSLNVILDMGDGDKHAA
jgi:hypothetical protein